MQAPLRLHLCQKFSDDQQHTLQEIFDVLKEDYADEAHFTIDNLRGHIQALKAIGVLSERCSQELCSQDRVRQEALEQGVLELCSQEQSTNDNHRITYCVTHYGKKKIKKAL